MDPRDQTFMTIHNLTPDANILFASDSILDILGYQPDEVRGKSAFDYFHPDEVPFARSIHSRGVLLDKAAVLHYARILSKSGQWVSCECCFTVVHNVLVASTSIYFKGERSERRARDAPQIRHIFSSSPRDPRYRMLEHLSPKFKMPPMEREPRAALILNRFTRNLTIMYATDVVTQILGLRPDELVDRPFYDCIQSNCIDEAERCLESAKANESIAYLRFWYRDPRTDPSDSGIGEEDEEPGEAEDTDDEADWRSRSSGGSEPDMKEPREPHSKDSCMEIDRRPDTQTQKAKGNDNGRENGEDDAPLRGGAQSPRQSTRRPPAPQTFELEAVVSCTSDGLVVVLRRARPPIPSPQPPVPPAAFNFENGLFAAPWGRQPIEPYISPDLLYTFRAPLLPQYMPLRDCIKAAGGPPMDHLMRSIRDVAVFAWAVTGINENLATYGQGQPRLGAQPADTLPVWEPGSGPEPYLHPESQAASRSAEVPEERSAGGPLYGHGIYQSDGLPAQGYARTRHASLDQSMYESRQPPTWAPTTPTAPYHRGGGYDEAGQHRRPLRPSFSYDALHDHARHRQDAFAAPPLVSSEAAPRRCISPEDAWTERPSSARTCVPSSGTPSHSPRGSGTGESSRGSGYFWQY